MYLGGIMKNANNKPPGFNPYKNRYMMLDLQRGAKHFKVPLKGLHSPQVLFRSLPLMRVATAALEHGGPALCEEVSRLLWYGTWRDKSPCETEDLPAILSALPEDTVATLLEKANSDSVKNLLRANTDEASELGAFGAPWIVVTTESGGKVPFFGSDRMEQICECAGVEYQGSTPQPASSL
ncbi:MAG: hypothetical protein MHM6MM_002674 [Cercozoa sp. M6MM]